MAGGLDQAQPYGGVRLALQCRSDMGLCGRVRLAIGDAIARFLALALPRRLMRDKRYFPLWEARGYHVTPVHFYEPIPDTRTLTEKLWSAQSCMVGIELNEQAQLQLLSTFVHRFRGEYDRFPRAATRVPHEYYLDNGFFGSVDGEILYCVVRHFRPRRIVEIGAGYSTYVTAQAIRKNQTDDHAYECELVAVEPNPNPILERGFPGLSRLLHQRVQDTPLSEFERLTMNDVLSIDSSHVLTVGSDVHYEFLEIIPRLQRGVIVHVHDILLPAEYKRRTVLEKYRFWTEQYLLQAFLTFNDSFEILWTSHFMHLRHPNVLAAAFESYRRNEGRNESPPVSFWMRRIR
jgi:hypothetical protein